MSKRTNTLLFVLGATVFNILVTVAAFIVMLMLFARFLAPVLPEGAVSWGLPFIFVASIALAFVIYRWGLKLLMARFDLEKHFDPIFGPKKPKFRRD